MLDRRTMTLCALGERSRLLLDQANRSRSFHVRVYLTPGLPRRVLIVLGEGHFKFRAAHDLGKSIVNEFALRGVEGFDCNRLIAGFPLKFLFRAVEVAIRGTSLGVLKSSTIREAWRSRSGVTVGLETLTQPPACLHFLSVYLVVAFGVGLAIVVMLVIRVALPDLGFRLSAVDRFLVSAATGFDVHLLAAPLAYVLRRRRWSWLVHPLVALVTVRDELMASGTLRMLEAYPEPGCALVVMGRAHLPGYGGALERLGFQALDPALLFGIVAAPGPSSMVEARER